MLRRIALGSLAFAIAFVVACGHQVTPEPSLANNNLAGKMQIRFRTNGPLNFTSYTYAIVLNTCGAGPPFEPYPNVFATSFNNYSFAFLLGGQYGTAFPTLEQYILTPGTTNSLNPQPVVLTTSTTNLMLNSNGQNTEFELTFTRDQLNNPLGVPQPCPNIPTGSASPVASPSASAGPSPSASPRRAVTSTATPTASPSASPSTGPVVQPTTQAQQYWYINFFSIDNGTKSVLDSLGTGGAQDTTYVLGIETGSTNQNPINKAVGNAEPSDPSAQVEGGEVDNYL